MELPDGEELRALELQSRHLGSGIKPSDLIGRWRLQMVWPKGKMIPAQANGALLRALKATLAIAKGADSELTLNNSVSFAGLELCFTGPGKLVQRRPLLSFYFNKVAVSVAGREWLSTTLPAPDHRREPFFALIDRKQTEAGTHWLAARGRGGGLALWILADGRLS